MVGSLASNFLSDVIVMSTSGITFCLSSDCELLLSTNGFAFPIICLDLAAFMLTGTFLSANFMTGFTKGCFNNPGLPA